MFCISHRFKLFVIYFNLLEPVQQRLAAVPPQSFRPRVTRAGQLDFLPNTMMK